MLTQFILCPILFSFLYQITNIKGLTFKNLFSRSKCDFCHKAIPTIYLLPIINYFMLKGKSICCNQKLHITYLYGEILAFAAIIVLNMSTLPVNNSIIVLIYFSLLALALYDFETYTIPIHIPIIMLVTTLIISPIYYLQGMIITIFLHLLFYCCKNAIGYGDILIFSTLSFILPFNIWFLIIWLTFIIGGCFTLIYIFFKHSFFLKIPLVPFIFCAFITVALCYPLLSLGGVGFEN